MFSEDIGMSFGVQKCGVVIMNRGKVVNSDDVQLSNGETIKIVCEEGYNYFGMLELDEIIDQVWKSLYKRNTYEDWKRFLNQEWIGRMNEVKDPKVWKKTE